MEEIEDIANRLIEFSRKRDWKKFHNPKDIALSISLEAAELLEIFQWVDTASVDERAEVKKSDIEEELADIFNWVILMSKYLDINILEAANEKIRSNGSKYPIAMSKGSSKKYTELG